MVFWSIPRNTIASILSPISDVIADLDKYENTKLDEADLLESDAMVLQDKAAKAHFEAYRAAKLSQTLKELMTTDV